MTTANRLCNCESGLLKRPLYDAAGIFCCYMCDKCEPDKRRQYAPALNTNSQYAITGREEDIE